MLKVSELYIYPIKSLGGISLDAATLTSTGFQHDRRWMLIDEHNSFLTQREHPQMALLQVTLANDGLLIHHKKNKEQHLFIPFEMAGADMVSVTIWDDVCMAQLARNDINNWFSNFLSMQCKLVYMPDNTKRKVDERYAINESITAFSDGYPLLIVGQSSLDDLNSRLAETLPMNRFRPNIVFTGGEPYAEDTFEEFHINENIFFGVKLSGRCIITTINQDEATKAKEPLKTLAGYRAKNNKIYFGQNVLQPGKGTVRKGDTIEIIKRKQSLFEDE